MAPQIRSGRVPAAKLRSAPDGSKARLRRMRRTGILALVLWPLFAALDLFIVHFVQPGPLEFFLALRGLGTLLLALTVAGLYSRKRISSRKLVAIETFMLTALTTLVSVQCLEFRGISSPLALGIVTVLLFRSAFLADNWKRSIIPVGTATIAYPLTLVALTQISSSIRGQFSDPTAIAYFALNVAFVVAAATVTLIGGHVVWKLRKSLAENTSLGRYQLKKLIGQGGMGEVWSAYHQAMRREVAVKILHPGSTSDPTAVARFEREVRATAELSHPNTVRVYDYGVTEEGLWYYAMERLHGEDLGSVLRRGAMPSNRAADVIYQASRALAEAHSRGIVHRDIKPENLFLTSLGGEADFVKVLDFGLVKLASTEDTSNLTQTGWAVGTPSYVSPEVVTGKPADARSDVYALGAVLYTLLCGRTPFSSDDMRAVLMAHLREAPLPPSQRLGRPIAAELEAVVMKCLEKDPAHRFADAGELANALAACSESMQQANHIRLRPPARHAEPLHQKRAAVDPHSRPRPRAITERSGLAIRQIGDPAPTFLTRSDWRRSPNDRQPRIGADVDTSDEHRTVVHRQARRY